MSAFENRLNRAEEALGAGEIDRDARTLIPFAWIYSKDEVHYDGRVMTLAEYERDILPGVEARVQRHFERTGRRPITGINYMPYEEEDDSI